MSKRKGKKLQLEVLAGYSISGAIEAIESIPIGALESHNAARLYELLEELRDIKDFGNYGDLEVVRVASTPSTDKPIGD